MKKIFLWSLAVALLLSGCGGTTVQSSQAPTSGEPTTPVQTTVDTQPPLSQTEPTEPVADGSYIQRIALADQSIFDSPTYDGRFVGVVEQAGAYTIVEEATDYEGNLWGKLKSGRGWVDLTEIRSGRREELPVTVNYADPTLLNSGNYVHCAHSFGPYMVQIAMRPNRTLYKFTFAILTYEEDHYEIYEPLIHFEELSPQTPLVADVEFPGDMSMYAMTFTDSDGVFYSYLIAESGRNNTVGMAEFDLP